MPPKQEKESLVLIINIGVTSPGKSRDPSSLEIAKNIAKRKIEKMIFLRPKDEVAIIVMGSPNTKNSLNSEHIEEFTNFEVPNWDFIRKVVDLKGTNYCSNWVEALHVAVEFMKKNICDASTKSIILMSDFNEEEDIISQFNADTIAEPFLSENIKLVTIGEDSLNEIPESSLKLSEVLLKDLHKQINGQHITFDDAVSSLKFYTEMPKKPCPKYFTLELVDKKIPVVSYVKVDSDKFSAWQRAKGDKKVKSKILYTDRQRNTYTKDEIVTGYKYGEIFVSVEEEQEEAMSYKSGPKSYKIHSFANRNNINLEYLYGNSTHVILPSNKETTKTFYSLVQAMHKTNSIAIVRKVSGQNLAPKMVALFPCVDIPNEPWCLVEITLTFAEDQRVMGTRPIKSVVKQLSNEQNEVVDNLIDSLTLPDIGDSCEVDGRQYFLPGCVPNPAVQHRWHMLSYRVLNPNVPSLPSMENYLKEILEAPSVKERSKVPLTKIAELFQLQNIDSKSEKKEEEHVQENDNIDTKIETKTEDTVAAENDSYKKLFSSMDVSDVDSDEMDADI